jgi:hypothetical protein
MFQFLALPVKIGDGKSTCFLLDSWLGNKPLSVQFPALFSHVQSSNVLVADCCTDNGWMLRFRHITFHRAQEELGLLLDRLNLVSLSEESDEQFMRFGPNKNFSVKNCYYALNFGGVSCVGNREIWNSFAPKKCKIFAWLALHNRLNMKERLLRRGVVMGSTCPFGCQADEDLTYMLFLCPHTSFLWRNFNIQNL